MKLPDALWYWKVDEIIEAVEYTKAGISTERWHHIEARLMNLAPTAYQRNGVRLSRVWDDLTEDEQNDIARAHRSDYWGDK